ncbi:hypothetical protein HQ584_01085, partial [Patescibacteria group bacterium]|nr:hypothetical protein [Patescibacteria group bacterium]
MSKLHQNIFYYYRGPQKEGKNIDEQLENNTTKALINVIENLSDKNHQLKLLRKITGKENLATKSETRYTLQSGGGRIPFEISSIAGDKRLILGISKLQKGKNELDGNSKDYPTSDNKLPIADAWIWCNQFVIIIETKVGDNRLYWKQLNGYKKSLKLNRNSNKNIIIRSWVDNVYPVISELSKKLKDDKDKFLLEQFKEYLEVIGMSKFEGFKRGDFVMAYGEGEEVEYLSKKFDALDKEVFRRIKQKSKTKKFKPRWREDSPGIGWTGFYEPYTLNGKKIDRCNDMAHFSIFEHNGIEIKLHIVKEDLKKLREKIRKNKKKEDKFRRIIKKSGEGRITFSRTTVGETRHRPDGAWNFEVYLEHINKRPEGLDKLMELLEGRDNPAWLNLYFKFNPEDYDAKIVDDIVINNYVENIVEILKQKDKREKVIFDGQEKI